MNIPKTKTKRRYELQLYPKLKVYLRFDDLMILDNLCKLNGVSRSEYIWSLIHKKLVWKFDGDIKQKLTEYCVENCISKSEFALNLIREAYYKTSYGINK